MSKEPVVCPIFRETVFSKQAKAWWWGAPAVLLGKISERVSHRENRRDLDRVDLSDRPSGLVSCMDKSTGVAVSAMFSLWENTRPKKIAGTGQVIFLKCSRKAARFRVQLQKPEGRSSRTNGGLAWRTEKKKIRQLQAKARAVR